MSAPAGVGCNLFLNAAVDESPAVAVHVGPTLLYFLSVTNPDATDNYIQLFDSLLADVSVGTTVPKQSFMLPGGVGGNDGLLTIAFPVALQFNTGLVVAITTTATGSGAPTGDAVVNLGYMTA